MVDSEPVDGSGHGILKSEANKLYTMCPTKYFLKRFTNPFDQFAFPGTRHPMNQIEHRLLVWCFADLITVLLMRFEDQAFYQGMQELLLFSRWFNLARLQFL